MSWPSALQLGHRKMNRGSGMTNRVFARDRSVNAENPNIRLITLKMYKNNTLKGKSIFWA